MKWAPFYMVISHVYLAAALVADRWFFLFGMGVFFMGIFVVVSRDERGDK